MLKYLNISIPEDWFNGDRENYRVLIVNGNTYQPYFKDKDVLIFCKDIEKIQVNDIIVCEIDGILELRKLCIQSEDTTVLESITPHIPPCINLEHKKIGFLYMLVRNYKGKELACDYE